MVKFIGKDELFPEHRNKPIVKYYLLGGYQNEVYAIKETYFLEAAKEHGARFHQMLQQFEIVK